MANGQSSETMRLLILHLNLAELCTGKSVEDASTEECSQQILHYFDDSRGQDIAQDQVRQEAVQFALLCSALYRLPDTIGGISRPPVSSSRNKFDSSTFWCNIGLQFRSWKLCRSSVLTTSQDSVWHHFIYDFIRSDINLYQWNEFILRFAYG